MRQNLLRAEVRHHLSFHELGCAQFGQDMRMYKDVRALEGVVFIELQRLLGLARPLLVPPAGRLSLRSENEFQV